MKKVILILFLLPFLALSQDSQNLVQAFIDSEITTAKIGDLSGKPLELTSLTYHEAESTFNSLANNNKIPFDYIEDGCYARAHEMVQLMEEQGIISAKIFLEGRFTFQTPDWPRRYIRWLYHVAPIIKVRISHKKFELYVLDPSLFTKPVTIKKWAFTQLNWSTDYIDKIYLTQRFQYLRPKELDLAHEYKESELTDSRRTLERLTRKLERIVSTR